ncbi:hypothetical protein CLCR_01359 [Cladophialophora carrionii]|uniref:Uncharacterized protein n=1 Tax=Cladophialophora carrionii TaxID=86049 RepID=A0A1C1CCQ1_9EURO|nr:hypothetical protein CLCR_01359 [Cladophialophora carrionii]
MSQSMFDRLDWCFYVYSQQTYHHSKLRITVYQTRERRNRPRYQTSQKYKKRAKQLLNYPDFCIAHPSIKFSSHPRFLGTEPYEG